MLTSAQQAIVKADILADPTLNAFPNNSDGAFGIAALYNLQAVPAFSVWRSSVLVSEVKKNIVWTEYVSSSISVAERDAFNLMISNGEINYSDLNIRQGISDLFNQAQTQTTFDQFQLMGVRLATRIEKLLATGTGTPALPGTMGFEGNISHQDVLLARNS